MARRKKVIKDTEEIIDNMAESEVEETKEEEELKKEEATPLVLTAPKMEKPAPKKLYPNPNAVSLRVFLTACGIKLDQMAGYQNYAIRHKLGPMTIKEWRVSYAEFLNRPMG